MPPYVSLLFYLGTKTQSYHSRLPTTPTAICVNEGDRTLIDQLFSIKWMQKKKLTPSQCGHEYWRRGNFCIIIYTFGIKESINTFPYIQMVLNLTLLIASSHLTYSSYSIKLTVGMKINLFRVRGKRKCGKNFYVHIYVWFFSIPLLMFELSIIK